MQTTGFLKAFWRLTKPYWMSAQRRKGITLLTTVIGLALMLVWLELQFNEWNRDFYNTLESRDQDEFFRQFGRFALLALVYIVTAVYRLYFQQMLVIEWRTWLTEHYLKNWLSDQAYYRMSLGDRGTDNPDQRIQEDLKFFVDYTLSLLVGLISAVATLIVFVGVLWALSGPITLGGVTIPGYLVWAAVLYAGIGTWLTHRIGKPLIKLDFDQQRYEADFRFSLVRFRENSEGVALYRGEPQEMSGFLQRFHFVITNWWALMLRQKRLGWFTSFYAQLAIIFPYVMVAPRYFSGSISMGVIFQAASAFNQVQNSLSWFINAYTNFAVWKATVDRLIGFSASLEKVRELKVAGERTESASGELEIANLALDLPQGKQLLANTSLKLRKGEDVLVTGPSGAGKSTLFRALAGIWPYWKGAIRLPQGAKLLFLPQKPYLPIGSLKDVACYPGDGKDFSDDEVRETLTAVSLPHLADQLERNENWAQVLSGGEQQRLAFARALLNRPEWLFLDEATASLPEDAQDALYGLLKTKLTNTTIVSIGHRESLVRHHDKRLAWQSNTLAAI